jgi:predicted aspartyl protease
MSRRPANKRSFLAHPLVSLFAILLAILVNNDALHLRAATEVNLNADTDADEILLQQAELLSDNGSLIIPLKNAGRLFMVEAEIDGQSGNLIFDTGSSGIVLNRTYFRKYVPVERQNSNGITGGVDKPTLVNVGKLKISEVELSKFTATVADLSHIENCKGVKVLGLFGLGMIKNFEIVIDFNRQILHLYKIDKEGNRINSSSPAFIADYSQNVMFSGNILFLKGTVADKELKFCLDTGAETNVISSESGKEVLKTISITHKSDLQGVGSKRSDVIMGTMSDFKFGTREMPGMTSMITNLGALSEAYNTSLDGMLGYDFLKRGTFCINLVKKQIGIIYTKIQ